MTYREPVRLTADHDVSRFRCGRQPLDEWLKRFALINQHAGMATTFVTTAVGSEEVVGYYALATGGVDHQGAPAKVTKKMPRHPIPVVILARMAVHEDHQGKALGRGLLRDALLRVSNAADEIGVRALLIHAKDEDVRGFYLAQAEFEPSPIDPLQLFLLLEDLRTAINP